MSTASASFAGVLRAPVRINLSRWQVGLTLVGMLALAAGLAVLDGGPVGVVHDDAMYVILARSLASGSGYRYLNIPGAPAATHFPPGYPALLAALSFVLPAFPANIVAFKMVNACCLAVASVLVARFARLLGLSDSFALALAAMCALSIPLLILGSMVLSEPLFLVLLLALLPALESFAESDGDPRRAVMLGIALGLAVLVRSHGIVLIPAAAVVLAARRRWRDALLLAGAAVLCLLPWQLWSATHSGRVPAPLLGNYDSYAGWWLRGLRETGPSMIGATLAKTVAETGQMLAVLFSPIRGSVAHAATLLALAIVAGAGAWSLRRRMPVTLLFVAAYLAIVLVWPFNPSRFIWGIWPLLLLFVVAGAHDAVTRLRHAGRAQGVAVFSAFAWVMAGYGLYEARAARGEWWSSIARANARRIEPAVQWIRANTAAGDVLAVEDEGAVFLYTGRYTVPVFSFTTAQYLREYSTAENATEGLLAVLASYPVHTVVVGSARTAAAADYLANRPVPRLAPRASFPGGVAYTVLPK